MKKKFYTLIIWIFVFSAIRGQLVESLSLKGGGLISNQSWIFKQNNFKMNTNSKTGLYIAASADILASKNFCLTTDLAYSSKGHSQEIAIITAIQPNPIETQTFYTHFNYLSISPILKFRHKWKKISFYGILGPRFDCLINAKVYDNSTDFEFPNRYVFGSNIGCGLSYQKKQLDLFIESQYQFDLTKAVDLPITSNSLGLVVNNRSLVVCAGFRYFLRNR